MRTSFTRSPDLLFLGLLIFLKILLNYVLVDPAYDLQRDEYLHLDQANHLAAGYLSVPPFTSWVAWVIKLLGNSVFWVRFFPALFGALTLLATWKMVEELGGGFYAKALAGMAVLVSALLRVNMLFQPNSFDILSWTLVYYFLIRYLKTQNGRHLLYLGLVVGLGFLNKYNILFLLIGLLPALLLTGQGRIFLNRYFYLAVLLTALLVLPNVIWQFTQGLPVIHHMEELQATQLVNVDPADFWFDQILFFFGSVYLIIGALVAFVLYVPFKEYRFIGLSYLITMALFTYLRAKSYYTLGLYPVLLAFGSVYWEHLFHTGWKRYLRPLWILLNIALFLPLVNVVFPLLSPAEIQAKAAKFKKFNLLKWEDGKDHPLPQDFADMLGWRELTSKVQLAYNQIPEAEKPHTLLLCDNYGQAGAINFYGGKLLPHAVSFNADYVYWFPMKMDIRNIILIKSAGEEPLQEEEKQFFTSVTQIGAIETTYAREQGTSVHLLRGVSPVMTQRLRARTEEKKQEW
ncbi:glycosyltransferase family 39 protein [Rufibacter hautae]|uniref:Glycosyltransferase family 39 protein n=1 Tax=Rufibacter hautae TaxID=2595005 RepID=A0A5B6TCU1_9BACT|nr:glycosyltransferase family 39 protein [Rufibacter hautae]KAA3436799.1 glycosyltransferase family 39 protein [Rufibacter hautae]